MYENTLILGSGANLFFINTSAADGSPITLAGASLACHVNGGARATDGLALSVDYNDGGGAVVGKHRVSVDVDDATLALADGDMVEVYLAAGTVDGVSVVGKLVARLMISDGSLLAGTQADIRAALGFAAADADGQLGAIAERTANLPDDPADASVVAAATDAILAAVGALNNLSQAGVEAALDAQGLTSAVVTALRVAALLTAGDWERVGDTITLSDGTTLELTEVDGVVTGLDVTVA